MRKVFGNDQKGTRIQASNRTTEYLCDEMNGDYSNLFSMSTTEVAEDVEEEVENGEGTSNEGHYYSKDVLDGFHCGFVGGFLPLLLIALCRSSYFRIQFLTIVHQLLDNATI